MTTKGYNLKQPKIVSHQIKAVIGGDGVVWTQDIGGVVGFLRAKQSKFKCCASWHYVLVGGLQHCLNAGDLSAWRIRGQLKYLLYVLCQLIRLFVVRNLKLLSFSALLDGRILKNVEK